MERHIAIGWPQTHNSYTQHTVRFHTGRPAPIQPGIGIRSIYFSAPFPSSKEAKFVAVSLKVFHLPLAHKMTHIPSCFKRLSDVRQHSGGDGLYTFQKLLNCAPLAFTLEEAL